MAAESTGEHLAVAVLSPQEKAALFGATLHCVQGDDLYRPPEAVSAAARGMLDEILALIDHGTPPVRHPWIAALSEDWREVLFAALLASEDDRHGAVDLLSPERWTLLQGLFETLNLDDDVGVAMRWGRAGLPGTDAAEPSPPAP